MIRYFLSGKRADVTESELWYSPEKGVIGDAVFGKDRVPVRLAGLVSNKDGETLVYLMPMGKTTFGAVEVDDPTKYFDKIKGC